MADNTQINQTTLPGDVIRTVDRSTAKTQIVGIDIGGDTGAGNETLLTQSNPMPVAVVDTDASQAIDNPAFQTIVGLPDGDYAGLPLLELVMNPVSGEALNVNILNQKTDALGAAVPSDAVMLLPVTLGVSGTICVVDTKGYAAISLELAGTWAGSVTFFSTNDLQNTVAVYGISEASPMSVINSATANGQYTFSTRGGRYFVAKLAYTSGLLVAVPVLRRDPVAVGVSANIQQLAGSTVVTGGLAGTLGVGGPTAVGSAPAGYPTYVGGKSQTALTAPLQTDVNGSPIVAGALTPGYSFGNYNQTLYGYSAPIAASILTAAQSTINPVVMGGGDAQGFARRVLTDAKGALQVGLEAPAAHGQSVVDLLTNILAALCVNNFYQAELYRVGVGAMDDPDTLLNDYLTRLAN